MKRKTVLTEAEAPAPQERNSVNASGNLAVETEYAKSSTFDVLQEAVSNMFKSAPKELCNARQTMIIRLSLYREISKYIEGAYKRLFNEAIDIFDDESKYLDLKAGDEFTLIEEEEFSVTVKGQRSGGSYLEPALRNALTRHGVSREKTDKILAEAYKEHRPRKITTIRQDRV